MSDEMQENESTIATLMEQIMEKSTENEQLKKIREEQAAIIRTQRATEQKLSLQITFLKNLIKAATGVLENVDNF